MEELAKMEMGAGMMLFMALFWLITLIIAFLSVILKDVAGRWANIVQGIVFTILNIWHLAEHLMKPSVQQMLVNRLNGGGHRAGNLVCVGVAQRGSMSH